MLMLVLFAREDRYMDLLHGPAGLSGLLMLIVPAVWIYRRLGEETAVDSSTAQE